MSKKIMAAAFKVSRNGKGMRIWWGGKKKKKKGVKVFFHWKSAEHLPGQQKGVFKNQGKKGFAKAPCEGGKKKRKKGGYSK